MSDIVSTKFYLVVECNPSTSRLSVRTAKNRPSLGKNEIAVQLGLILPKALFTRPTLSAEIRIPDDAVPSQELDLQMVSNIAEVIRQNLGIEMRVGFEEPQP